MLAMLPIIWPSPGTSEQTSVVNGREQLAFNPSGSLTLGCLKRVAEKRTSASLLQEP